MKLISLNIWGGQAYAPLMDFVRASAPDTDIFCFQEVLRSSLNITEVNKIRINILADLAKALPEFRYYFAPEQEGFDLSGMTDLDVSFGQATFVKKTHKVESTGSVFVWRNKNEGTDRFTIPANFLYSRLLNNGKKFTIANIHGVALPGDKLDNPDRIAQSQKIIDFFSKEEGEKIICGDFNLLPKTQSVKMLEDAGLMSLIRIYDIQETRNKLSPFYGKPEYQKFADFTFVSKEVEVKKFEVPYVEASDHLPMILEFA